MNCCDFILTPVLFLYPHALYTIGYPDAGTICIVSHGFLDYVFYSSLSLCQILRWNIVCTGTWCRLLLPAELAATCLFPGCWIAGLCSRFVFSPFACDLHSTWWRALLRSVFADHHHRHHYHEHHLHLILILLLVLLLIIIIIMIIILFFSISTTHARTKCLPRDWGPAFFFSISLLNGSCEMSKPFWGVHELGSRSDAAQRNFK